MKLCSVLEIGVSASVKVADINFIVPYRYGQARNKAGRIINCRLYY